jgi:AbrB family looped-hinge helix DNA binding protein
MPTATMTTKGQVTIPLAVRQALALGPGSKLRFVELPDGNFEIMPATVPVASLKGFFGPWEGPAVTTEQMSAAIAQTAARANL